MATRSAPPLRKKSRKGLSIRVEHDNDALTAIEAEYNGTGNRINVPVPALLAPPLLPASPLAALAADATFEAAPDVLFDDGPGSRAPDPNEPDPHEGSSRKRQSRWKASSLACSTRNVSHVYFQAPSVLMAEFQQRQDQMLDCLLSGEFDPRCSDPCSCGSLNIRSYRCRDCFVSEPCCAACLKASHAHAPFHRIEKWTGSYFARSNLFSLDYELCLGHNGRRCPAAPKPLQPSLVIVHTNGVHRMRVCYCDCAPRPSNSIQLLRASLYPGTWKQPSTAFTLHVLKNYHLDSLQSRKPAYDYWAILRRQTDNTRVNPVPDHYEDLLRVSREWRILSLLKRSGQFMGISAFLPNQSTSVAVICPACPRPGLNLPENWKELVTDQNRHEYTIFLGIDGNYHAVSKEKRYDPNDVPLLDGRGYFTNMKRYEDYLSNNSTDDTNEHKSSCANLKNMQSITQRKGLKVAGIVAVFDVRHSMYMPGSLIDLEAGEKFRILDYAVAQAIGPEPAVELHRVLTCDKGCQYVVNMLKRFTKSFPSLVPVVERLTVLVPKLHLQGHKEDCRYRYSLNYTAGCGRTDGEGVERPWGHSNDTAKITRDQNPGHRKDTYDDSNGDWNYCKSIDMASSIVAKLKACYKDLAVARENFDALSQAIPSNLRAAWEKLSCKPVPQKNGVVKSVFRADRKKLPSYQELLEALEGADQNAAGDMLDATLDKIYCLTNFISAGLELEERQIQLKGFIAGLPEECDRIQLHDLFTRRFMLREQLTSFRALQQVHMPRLGPAQTTEDVDGDDDEDFGRPEDEPLDLPSSFGDENERERFGFVEAGRREYVLRTGLAVDSLGYMRVAIHAYNASITFKHANITGHTLGTRANTKVDARVDEIHRWRDAYRRHRAALVTLGLKAEDADRFQPLLDNDLKNLHEQTALRPPRQGEAREPAAWFWGGDRDPDDSAVTDMDSLTQEELRTRWFRLRANFERYVEEVDILHAELARTVATFKRMQAIWENIAARQFSPPNPGLEDRSEHIWSGRRAYALKQASIYAQRVHDAQVCVEQASGLKEASAQKRAADRHRKQSTDWVYKWSFY